jgi:geranylgeranyl diphosphate synthase, type I
MANKAQRRSTRGRRRGEAGAKSIQPNRFFLLLPTIQREVEARLLGFVDEYRESSAPLGKDVAEMLGAVRSLCARGGKRLRPALAVAGFRAAHGALDLDVVLDAGVALELLQAYFLIHDDWMDQDDVRRGGPTVHKQLAQRFRSAQKGEHSAILAGDYAVALALAALSRLEMPARRAQAIMGCFAEMQLDAVLGQQIDLMGKSQHIETTYSLKTGSYTVRGPLRLGALLAGGSPTLLIALDRFAMPAGVAFQLRDDLIGVFGDPATTGKPRGSDISAGKRTALLVVGMKRAKGAALQALRQAYGNPKASTRQLDRAIQVLDDCGARGIVQARIEELSGRAEEALAGARLRAEGRELLLGALHALTQRIQ